MEPMALGSPVGSPAAPQHTTPVSSSASTFIPSYLMGDIASPAATSSRVVGSGSTSPNKTTRQFSSSATVSTPGSPQPCKDPFFSSRLGQDKPGGPPTQSLMGIRAPPALPQSPIPSHIGSPFIDNTTQGTPVMGYASQGTSGTGYSTPLGPPSQLGYTSAFTPSRDHTSLLGLDVTPSHEVLEDTWVTVFGFPVPAASYILTQFAQFGTITEHQMPGTGNWMHLKYQTKLQARKALSKNGKVFSGNIMVGVVPCSDKTLLVDKENNISSMMSPQTTSLPGTPKASMRPLTQAYQTAHAEHEVIPKINTPKKSDGLVARAMQHILGL
ncbi:nucleoporin NUP35 isoform X2 [Palaemon carinicauda]